MAESHQLVAEERFSGFEVVDVLAMTLLSEVLLVGLGRARRLVVIKRPRSEWSSEPVILERFRSERILGQQLRHENLVRILPSPSSSEELVLMEYAPGRTLREELRTAGRLGVRRAIALARQVCSALAYLHERRIVHGSVRPEHLWLTRGDRVQLLDLGAARVLAGGVGGPRPGCSIGGEIYRAPEQLRRRQPDAASDVYGTGAVLYEMMTGISPYAESEPWGLTRAKQDRDPIPPGTLLPLDASVEQIVLRATARDVRQRYPSIAALARDLAGQPAAVRPMNGPIRDRR